MRYAAVMVLGGLALNGLAVGGLSAQVAQTGSKHAIVARPDSIAWSAGPVSLPAGARAAVIEGDPSKPGLFTLRLSMPEGYRIPPHFHPADEHVTVISGSFQVGMGDRFDETRLITLDAGSFGMLPTGMHHFARARVATVIQLHGIGPWSLTYVNPADDPRKVAK